MRESTCQHLAQLVSPYMDGELSTSETIDVQQHVEGCSHCAQLVRFERATRNTMKKVVYADRAPESLRAKIAMTLAEARSQGVEPGDVSSISPNLLSWKVVGALSAAAALVMALGAFNNQSQMGARPELGGAITASATSISLDGFVNDLIDQHVDPLPPEAQTPTEIPSLDRFVGVPVRALSPNGYHSQLLGARVVPVLRHRTAMLQYMLANGHRVSVYVYNPHQLPVERAKFLSRSVVGNAPVYAGSVRGYTVAVTDRQGVGYAAASDLDVAETSRFLVSHAP